MPTPTGRGRAPGKLVLSGAYSVLWGAPALVTAVDRFAYADASRPATHLAEEVQSAIELGFLEKPCFVDVSDLRADTPDGGSRKLGLGSSSAILLATMIAHQGEPESDDARQELFARALTAHKKAQGGGSGVDVAASTFGGTQAFELATSPSSSSSSSSSPSSSSSSLPRISPAPLPTGLTLVVFAARNPSTTSAMVRAVRDFAAREPADFEHLIGRAREGAIHTRGASTSSTWIEGLNVQLAANTELGDRAGIPIVPEPLRVLSDRAREAGAHFGPSGAGGGDVSFWASESAPDEAFVALARSLGLDVLALSPGALGASSASRGASS